MWWWWFSEQGRAKNQGEKFHKMTDDEIIDFVTQLPETCEIDIFNSTRAHDNIFGATLEVIAQATGLTRERVRQIEAKAIQKLRLHHRLCLLRDFKKDQYGTEKDPYYTHYPDAF
jgi:DNA-directed RNA polymerase sigma subunit (sigma70/sigma32)